MEKTALVIMPGGMRNAFAAGVLSGAALAPTDVGAVVSSSSGVGVGAYFLAGQIELAAHIFVDRLTRPEVYSTSHLLRGRRPFDVDYLIDDCCQDLDVDALVTASATLYAGVFRRHDGETFYQMVQQRNWRTILKATGAMPILARPVQLNDGHYYVDGGIAEALAVYFAYKLGFRRIILLCNRPLGIRSYAPGNLVSFLAFPWWPAARRALRNSSIHDIGTILSSPPADLLFYPIAPHALLPSDLLTRAPGLIQETHNIGFAAGIEHRDRLRMFCEGGAW